MEISKLLPAIQYFLPEILLLMQPENLPELQYFYWQIIKIPQIRLNLPENLLYLPEPKMGPLIIYALIRSVKPDSPCS